MTPSEVLTLGFVLYTEGALYFVGAGVLLLVTLLGCVLVIGGGEEDLVQLDPTHPQGSRRPLFV